jgi:hypothetical protein
VDVIIPTNLVCTLFGPAIPTLYPSIVFYTVTVMFFIALWAKPATHVFQQYHLAWFPHSILNFMVNTGVLPW